MTSKEYEGKIIIQVKDGQCVTVENPEGTNVLIIDAKEYAIRFAIEQLEKYEERMKNIMMRFGISIGFDDAESLRRWEGTNTYEETHRLISELQSQLPKTTT